jgi:hypothetical protein
MQVAVLVAAQGQPTHAFRLLWLNALHLLTHAGVDTAPTRRQRFPARHYVLLRSIVLQHHLAI